MSISLQQLRYLAAVAEHGSITAAATRLGVSQPVLSRALAALQEELNVPLLKRSNRKLILTPDGQAALAPARRAIAAVEDIKRVAMHKQTPPLLRIAAETCFAAAGASALKKTLGMHAEMHVEILLADNAESIIRLLASGQADIGIGEKPDSTSAARWVPWRQLELVLVSPLGLNLPPEVEFTHLADLRFISITASLSRQRSFDDLFLRFGIRPNVILEVEDISLLPLMARAGVGSFFGWRFFCEHYEGVELRGFKQPLLVPIGFSYTDTRNRQVREFISIAMGEDR